MSRKEIRFIKIPLYRGFYLTPTLLFTWNNDVIQLQLIIFVRFLCFQFSILIIKDKFYR